MIQALLADPYVRWALIGLLAACLVLISPLPEPGQARFGDDYVNAALILLSLTALARQRHRIRHVEERKFWGLLAVALAAWLAVIAIFLVAPPERDQALELGIDCGYLVFYVALLAAATSNPHLASGWTLRSRRYVIESFGLMMLGIGLLVYFAYVPSIQNLAEYKTAVPSTLLYTAFDVSLFASFLYLTALCRTPRWRWIYGALAASFGLWVGLDVVETLTYTGTIPELRSGTPLDLIWALPFLGILCAIRLRGLSASGITTAAVPAATPGQEAPVLRGPFLIYALLLPLLHYGLHAVGVLDDASRPARELVVLFMLLSLGMLAAAQHRMFEEERRQAEQESRRSEARYRELFERSLSANYVSSWDGKLLACNLAFARIFGFETVEEALSCPASRLYVTPESRIRFLNAILRQRRIEAHEWELRRRDGSTVWVLETCELVCDERDRPLEIRGQLIDLTEYRQLEEQLRQAQKLEAIGLLAGGVAHDFNNLLTGIVGHTELALSQIDARSAVAEDLRNVRQCSDRAASLVAQLLAFGRRQPLVIEVLDLNTTIDEGCRMLDRLIGDDIDLVFMPGADPANVRGDAGQIQQVLINLAVNARDAMSTGGRLVIRSANVEGPASPAPERHAPPPGTWVELMVCDSGCGMDAATLERIFEPFFTTKDVDKGTGLGLSTVYGIVRQHDGHIDVDSIPGVGTTFWIWLPPVDGAEARESEAGRPSRDRMRLASAPDSPGSRSDRCGPSKGAVSSGTIGGGRHVWGIGE